MFIADLACFSELDLRSKRINVKVEFTLLAYFLGERYIEGMQIDPRAVRSDLGLNVREFAERYRLPRRTVENWEQGRRISWCATLLLTLIQRDPETIARLLKDLPEAGQ